MHTPRTRRVMAALVVAALASTVHGAEARRDAYEYDAAGRLTRVVQGDGGEIRWERDAAGNVRERRVIAALAGDESGDGRLSVADAVEVIRLLEGAGGGTPRADCDASGAVAAPDVDCIRRHVLDAP